MTLKCLIIDDEPPAHLILETYINKLASLELVGNCYNALEALDFLHDKKVDLIFLDINMPEMTGIEFLKTLTHRPTVILTTAYSEYAIESYEVGVQDYLLKPIRFSRFVQAINRTLESHSDNDKSPETVTESKETFFYVKADGVQHKVEFEELVYMESKGNFVQLYLKDKKILTATTLSSIAELLQPHGFIRIHKSYIINKRHVKGLQGRQIIMPDIKLPIGNSYRQVVLSQLSF